MGDVASNPAGMHWAAIVFGWGLAISFGYWTTDFLVVQRVLSAKDLPSAQNGTIIGGFFKMLVPLIVILPGLLALAVLTNPDGSHVLLPENDPAVKRGDAYSYNCVLPLLLKRYCGPGLLGLGVTSLIAGFMSGMAGNVSAFATVWTYDVYKPFINRNASDKHYVTMGRACCHPGHRHQHRGRLRVPAIPDTIMALRPVAVRHVHRPAVRARHPGNALETRRRRRPPSWGC